MPSLKQIIILLFIPFLATEPGAWACTGPLNAQHSVQNHVFSTQAMAPRPWAETLGRPHQWVSSLFEKHFFAPSWRRDRNVLLSGSFITNIGFGMQIVAESGLIYKITHSSAFAVGNVTAAIPLGLATFAFLGAILATHMSKKGLIGVQLFRMTPPLVVALTILIHGTIPPGLVIACSFTSGMAQAVAFPLYQAMLDAIVKDHGDGHKVQTLARHQIQTQLGRAIGASVGATLLFRLGAVPTFLLVSASSLTFAIIISRVHTTLTAKDGNFWKQFVMSIRKSGRAIKKDPVFLSFCVLFGLSNAIGYPIFSLAPPAVDKIFHLPPIWQGYFQSSFTIGTTLASLVWGWRPKETRRYFIQSVGLFGLASMVFASGGNVGVGIVSEMVAGFAYIWGSLVMIGAIQTSISEKFRTAAFGPLYFCWYLGQAVGNVSAGRLAQSHAVAHVLQSYGGALFVVALVIYSRWRKHFVEAKGRGDWSTGAAA